MHAPRGPRLPRGVRGSRRVSAAFLALASSSGFAAEPGGSPSRAGCGRPSRGGESGPRCPISAPRGFLREAARPTHMPLAPLPDAPRACRAPAAPAVVAAAASAAAAASRLRRAAGIPPYTSCGGWLFAPGPAVVSSVGRRSPLPPPEGPVRARKPRRRVWEAAAAASVAPRFVACRGAAATVGVSS